MNAIASPIPEPLPPAEPPVIASEPTRDHHRIWWATALVVALAVGTAALWLPRNGSTPATEDPLADRLEWMFDATLTFPGMGPDGVLEAPFSAVDIETVIVVDESAGPMVATGIATLADGTRQQIVYELTVTRSDDGWSVRADRLYADGPDQPAAGAAGPARLSPTGS
jgi:hypothetical protein